MDFGIGSIIGISIYTYVIFKIGHSYGYKSARDDLENNGRLKPTDDWINGSFVQYSFQDSASVDLSFVAMSKQDSWCIIAPEKCFFHSPFEALKHAMYARERISSLSFSVLLLSVFARTVDSTHFSTSELQPTSKAANKTRKIEFFIFVLAKIIE